MKPIATFLLKPIATFLLAVLRNKWFWVVVGALIVLLVVRSNWVRIKALFYRDSGDYSDPPPDAARQEELKAMGQEAYTRIHQFPPRASAREAAFVALAGLNDTELRWTARYYRTLSRDESLYAAVQAEQMPLASVKQQLLARLSAIKQI